MRHSRVVVVVIPYHSYDDTFGTKPQANNDRVPGSNQPNGKELANAAVQGADKRNKDNPI